MVAEERPGSTTRSRVQELTTAGARWRRDDVVTEEPLEIRLRAGEEVRTLAVTMRTPGRDMELVAGYLHAEGITGLRQIRYCADAGRQQYNTVTAWLDRMPALASLERYGYTSSACGVCGKASLEALRERGLRPVPADGPRVGLATLLRLPERLRHHQGDFARTGGLHAAALAAADGSVECVREDVGRHNAVDKVVGWAAAAGRLPLVRSLLLVSGRTSYEIVQKAIAARIPVVAAISAPSSLAIAMAEEFGITLVGFLREGRCNVYSHGHRIEVADATA